MKETITIPELIEKYNVALESALKMNYLVRDSSLQEKESNNLKSLKNLIKGVKYQVIEHGDEKLANQLFHLQSALNSVSSLLQMWIAIKKEEYTAAWCLLIDAHEYLDLAMKAMQGNEGHWGLDVYQQKLKTIEEVCFPGFPLFNSWGAKTKGGKCTICKECYETCEHLEGLIYTGRLCVIVGYEVLEADHSSLVTNPRDRRCIINKISSNDGVMRDYITWRLTDEPVPAVAEAAADSDPMYMKCTLFVNQMIEWD